MAGLAKHYGTDARWTPRRRSPLRLATGPRRQRQARACAPPDDRITRGDWFIRKHREVSKAAWTRPAIKSAANCGACHRARPRGDYDEDRVRIPR